MKRRYFNPDDPSTWPIPSEQDFETAKEGLKWLVWLRVLLKKKYFLSILSVLIIILIIWFFTIDPNEAIKS